MNLTRWWAGLACATLLMSCGDDNPTGPVEPAVVGFWFKCELGLADDCATLDNDGYQFTSDGQVYEIAETSQSSLPQCGTSNCFAADEPSIEITRILVGSYTYDVTSLAISVGACSETVTWSVTADRVEYSGACLDRLGNAADDLVREYTGTVTVA